MAKNSEDKKQEKLAKSEKKAADKKAAQKKKKANPFQKVIRYCKDLKSEIKKVVWPSAKQIKNNSVVVLVFVVISAVFLSLIDLGLGQLVALVFG